MITIDGHTFDEKRLTPNGWIVDVGCRGFNFYLEMGCDVNYLGIDIDTLALPDQSVKFKQAALTAHPGETEAYFFGDGTANFIKGINETPGNEPDRPCETKTIPCITLQDIYKEIGTDIDLLKLDIEGAEYAILENIEPIPKQITVEFHEHVHTKLHHQYIDKVMSHLCKYYDCILHITEARYHYMDCLFIRKDL